MVRGQVRVRVRVRVGASGSVGHLLAAQARGD